MKQGRNIVSIVFVIALLFGLAVNVSAAEVARGKCGDNLTWVLDDSGTLTISGSGEMVRPESGYPWYSYRNQIESVVIQSGVTEVGVSAFEGYSNLKNLTIPKTVRYLGDRAFKDCTGITNVYISDLAAWLALEVNGDDSHPFSSLVNSSPDVYEGTGIHKLYLNGKLLTAAVIPEGTTHISSYAFLNCIDITSVTVPASVKTIGGHAFWRTEISDVYISDLGAWVSLEGQGHPFDTNMGSRQNRLYLNGKLVTRATIPEGVTAIASYSFCQCGDLTSVTIPDTVQSIGYYAFRQTGIKSVRIPEGVTEIRGNAFRSCHSLASVTLPASVTVIGNEAFRDCSALTAITLPSGVTTIEYGAFQYCSALTSINIPDSVTTIGAYAFSECTSLVSVRLPAGLKCIPHDMLAFCRALTEIEIPQSVERIEFTAFHSTSITELTIPQNVTYIDSCIFTYSKLKNVYFLGDAPEFGADALALTWAPDLPKSLTAYYPAGNPTWTAAVRQGYGSYVTWKTATQTLTIVTQPTGQKVLAGEDAVFNVSATGSGLQYQWQYRTSASGTWSACTATGNKTATVTVPATTGKSGWQYRCKITDSAGNTKYTNAVYLYVLGITAQPTGQKVLAGENAVFTVAATGHSKVYQWQYRATGEDAWAACTATGNKTSSMTVEALSWKSGYQYRCKITDSAGNVKYTNVVYLYVLGITAQPEGQKVPAGENAVFTVAATGHQKTYQWQYRTSADGAWTACTDTGNKTASMTVAATTAKSSYQYRCRITDSVGNVVYSKTVYLYVLGIKSQPVGQKVIAGNTATFSVSATGHSKTYQWQYRTSASGNWLNCTATGNKTATIKVAATTGKSSWRYRCQITDSAGNVIYTNVVYLYVLGVTSQPENTTAAAGGNAKFTFNATGHSKVYQWQYSADGGVTWKNTTATGCKSRTLTVIVTAAKNGYLYRCQITDSVGNVIYTDPAMLTVE